MLKHLALTASASITLIAVMATLNINSAKAYPWSPGYDKGHVCIKEGKLNVRASPSLDAPVKFQLEKGHYYIDLSRTESSNGRVWRRIGVGPKYGWAASKHLCK